MGRLLGEGKGYPLQYSGLENSTDCIVHGDAKSWTRLSDFHLSLKSYDVKSIHLQLHDKTIREERKQRYTYKHICIKNKIFTTVIAITSHVFM